MELIGIVEDIEPGVSTSFNSMEELWDALREPDHVRSGEDETNQGSQSMQSHVTPGVRGRPKNPDTERHIMRIAKSLFSSRGFDGVAMDDLARKAGISKTTIYRHFRTKWDLFKATFEHLLSQLPPAPGLTSGIAGASIEARLFVVARRTRQVLSSEGFEFIRRFPAPAISPLPYSNLREAVAMPYFNAIEDYLRSESARGTLGFDDSRLATSLFFALVAGQEACRSFWSGMAGDVIDDAYLRGAVQMFIKGHSVQSKKSEAYR